MEVMMWLGYLAFNLVLLYLAYNPGNLNPDLKVFSGAGLALAGVLGLELTYVGGINTSWGERLTMNSEAGQIATCVLFAFFGIYTFYYGFLEVLNRRVN